MNPPPIELRYETPTTPPPEITFQNFPDGGVTITIPFRKKAKGSLSGLAVGILILLYLLETPAFFLTIKHHHWHSVAFLAFAPTILPALILLAIFLVPRTPDFVEVIAVSPDLIYIKPTNSKGHTFPRSNFKKLEIRTPIYDVHGTIPRRITLYFHQGWPKDVCPDRTEAETQTVAEALQKAVDATAPSPPPESIGSGR